MPAEEKKIKIAIVTNRFYPELGGAEINIYLQAKELAQKYDVSVFCPKRMDLPKVEKIDNFLVYRLWDVFNRKNHFPNLKRDTFCPELFSLIFKENFDIVFCFPSINYNNILAFLAAKLTGKSIVLCSFDYKDYQQILHQKKVLDPDFLKNYEPSWKEKLFLSHLDYILAISNREVAFFKKYNSNVEYVPVPVQPSEYEITISSYKSRYQIQEDDFVFLCLGRISYIKGQDIALEAFQKALPKMPDAKLLFVGRTDYEPEFYLKLCEFVKQHHLEKQVIFTGAVDRQEVISWLKQANIHLIPVRFMNGGAVVAESWINGLPILCSDAVDPNLVEENLNGYLFPSENREILVKKMVTAYQQRSHLPELGKRGKQLVLNQYTYENLIHIYEKVYQQLNG